MKENKIILAVILIIVITFIVWLIAFWPTGIDCGVFTDYERQTGRVPEVCGV